MNIKELSKQPEKITSGHRLCAGCTMSLVAKHVMNATDDHIVVANATGCLEVATTIYPYTAWKVPWIHNAFENAGATISGVETAYRSLKKQGKIANDKEIKFLAFGGDGGTYDIGLQSLSGALERGHNFVYVCYDNEAYMNTGIQRSSATPFGAATNTSPDGKVRHGKTEFKKNFIEICAAHGIPYVAQANVYNYMDLMKKAKKAFDTPGPAVLVVMAPCTLGWHFPSDKGIEMAKLATETCFWPLFEVVDGKKWTINYKPKNKLPITDWIKDQGRFKHLKKEENHHIVELMQQHVDEKWDELLKKEEFTQQVYKE